MKMFNPVPHTSQEQELKSFKKKKNREICCQSAVSLMEFDKK